VFPPGSTGSNPVVGVISHCVEMIYGKYLNTHDSVKSIMRSGLVIIFVALLLVMPLCSAATTIKLNTMPGREVFVSIWAEGHGLQLDPPKKYLSDVYGHVEHVYEGTTSPFDVLVIVKSFGVQEYREEFGSYEIGGTVQLPDLVAEGYVNPLSAGDSSESDSTEDGSNDEVTSTDNSTNEGDMGNETGENNVTGITGHAISEGGFNMSPEVTKIIYYILGSVFVVGAIAAIVMFTMMKVRRRGSGPPVYGMAPVKLDKKYKREGSSDRNLDSIENEIEDVEKQIDMYRKRSRLSDAEKRLDEKRKMLESLKRGEK
jgi:hypothetical protein